MRDQRRPLRIINSVAPIRICDNGGWTDTWFAERGKIFNIGVYPYAEVQIEVYPYDSQDERIIIYAENYGQRYAMHPETPGWDRHPLLEAAIQRMAVPEGMAFQVTIFSEAPSGASTGTSASVTVALIGALDCLTPGRMTPHEVAYTAQSIEVDILGQQCGIQDQLCSAYGGINYIDTASQYKTSEEKIGHVMRKRRDECYLATKVRNRKRKEGRSVGNQRDVPVGRSNTPRSPVPAAT